VTDPHATIVDHEAIFELVGAFDSFVPPSFYRVLHLARVIFSSGMCRANRVAFTFRQAEEINAGLSAVSNGHDVASPERRPSQPLPPG